MWNKIKWDARRKNIVNIDNNIQDDNDFDYYDSESNIDSNFNNIGNNYIYDDICTCNRDNEGNKNDTDIACMYNFFLPHTRTF